MDSRCQVRKTTGFTLIELLVVVAIVVVIAAILFPVFAGVRERGRKTSCQSNLKQIALAMQQYVQDNNGTYPVAVRYEGQNCYAEWIPAIYPYMKDYHIIRCPDHPHTDPESSDADIEHLPQASMDYDYNIARLNGVLPAPIGVLNFRGKSESRLATSSTIWLNTDSTHTDSGGVCDDCRLVPQTSCDQSFTGSTIHSGAANYSYVDGHVKWLTPEEAGEIDCANPPPHHFVPAPPKD
jgi:prepilin-type N-terminal cleavage/methylation domain-containing protein/prepilin-type processing-associated H-X9-DG protein